MLSNEHTFASEKLSNWEESNVWRDMITAAGADVVELCFCILAKVDAFPFLFHSSEAQVDLSVI